MDRKDVKDSMDLMDSRTSRDSKDPRDPRNTMGSMDLRDPKDPRDPRETRGSMDLMDPRETRGSMDLRDPKDSMDPRDSRGSMDLMDSMDSRTSRDSKDPRDPRDTRGSMDSRDPKDSMDPRDSMDSMVPRDSRDSRDSWDLLYYWVGVVFLFISVVWTGSGVASSDSEAVPTESVDPVGRNSGKEVASSVLPRPTSTPMEEEYYYVSRTPPPQRPAPDNTVDFLPRQGGPLRATPTIAPLSKVSGILPNGSFDNGYAGWEKPDGVQIFRLEESEGRRGVIHFRMNRKTAEDTGLVYYSDPVAVESGRTYRVSADVKSLAPTVGIFIKGYGALRDRERQIYQAILWRHDSGKDWGTCSRTFTVSTPLGPVHTIRVMLYAYLKPGDVYFDHVAVREEDTATTRGASNHGR